MKVGGKELNGVALFLQLDGELYWAPIDETMAPIFVGMLPPHQGRDGGSALLTSVPAEAQQLIFKAQELVNEKLKIGTKEQTP